MYTSVYPRVHTIALSMFALGLSWVQFSGLTPRHSRDMAKRLPLGMKCPPQGAKERGIPSELMRRLSSMTVEMERNAEFCVVVMERSIDGRAQ